MKFELLAKIAKIYRYYTNCVNIPRREVDDLNDMIDKGEEITWREFKRNIDINELRGLYPLSEYSYEGESVNPVTGESVYLNIAKDWAISFYKSTFKGRPCYYLVHSAIEYIFI